MINLTIHDSVFAIPPQSNDIDEEKKNITMYYDIIENLRLELHKNAKCAIFISRDTKNNLASLIPQYIRELRARKKLIGNDPKFKVSVNTLHVHLKAILNTEEIKDDPYDIAPRNPVFGTLFFEDQFYDDINEIDIPTLCDNLELENKCSNKFKVTETASFDKLSKLIARLNAVTPTSTKHFLVLKQNPTQKLITFTLKGTRIKVQYKVFLVGFDKLDDYISKPEDFGTVKCAFGTVKCAYERAREKFKTENLIFGEDVYKKDISTLVKDPCAPAKIYYYLEALNAIAGYKRTSRNDISLRLAPIKMENQSDIDILLILIKAFGCDCGDHKNNRNYPESDRTWGDGSSGEHIFHLHLRPATEEKEEGESVRIYFDWDDNQQKFIVGRIGKHPKKHR